MSKIIQRTHRSTIKRAPRRGSYDRQLIHQILDAGKVCHVAFCVDEQPFVIPTAYGRKNDSVYIHGAAASRMLRHLSGAVECSFCVTLLDGLVLARSAFHHSMNYRSVVLFGRAQIINDRLEKSKALQTLTNHVWPNRWQAVRAPDDKELDATTVLMLPIQEASARVRTGGPNDDQDDMHLPVWAGEIPLRQSYDTPIPAPDLKTGIEVPEMPESTDSE